MALILYRIKNPETIDLRIPISETLSSLDRQQLQKLVQYIIAEHHTEVLPTAQRILDEMNQSFSEINQIQGAPDPTAGACTTDEHIWHLDEIQVNEKVYNYLNQVFSNSKDAHKQINALFEKIREMFRAKDSNGTRLLKLITEQFLQNATRNEKSRPLWDHLISLWVVVMLNPNISKFNKKHYSQLLNNWSKAIKCPKEDIERRTGIKRKATELYDDEDRDDLLSTTINNDYLITLNQSNNYPVPAHMATHIPRTYLPSSNNAFPVLKPYNQPTSMPSCSCQFPHSIIKKIRGHSMHQCHESHLNRFEKASTSSNHRNVSRNQENSLSSNENRPANFLEPRSIFHRALDFQDFVWNDPHLQMILNKSPINYVLKNMKSNMFDLAGNPLWNETIPQVAARIETLRSHGYKNQALRLALASIRRLKLQQDQWNYASSSERGSDCSCLIKGINDSLSECWLGHPLDPINIIVDLLLDVSTSECVSNNTIVPGSSSSSSTSSNRHSNYNNNSSVASWDLTNFVVPTLPYFPNNQPGLDLPIMPIINLTQPTKQNPTHIHNNSEKAIYHHVQIPDCCQKDSYLSLAFEFALMALGQQRSLPTTSSAHDRSNRQESELISKLSYIDLNSDPVLIEILKHQAWILLKGGPFHNACCGLPSDYSPIHTYCKYLFLSLLPHCRYLAFKIGIYALRLPISLEESDGLARATPRPFSHASLHSEQLALAQVLMLNAKGDDSNLRRVYKASIRNIRNPNYLLKLAKHAFKEGSLDKKPSTLMETSFDLTLQVLILTKISSTVNAKIRREAICFITDCAIEIGMDAVCRLLKEAKEYFSPMEALNLVFARDDIPNLKTKALSKLVPRGREDELFYRYRELVLECAQRDPPNCALDALKFCENHQDSLRRGLKIVIEAGATRQIDSSQLIKIADYISSINMERAFHIAMVAVDSLSILSNSDNNSSKKDIYSACEYARKVNGFSLLIPKLIENVECAIVLSEIYHQFHPETIHSPIFMNQIIGSGKPVVDLTFVEDVGWWDRLLKKTLDRFVDTTRNRLQNISPRHYAEFIEFLAKAQGIFEKAENGVEQFQNLVFDIIKTYRTKRKLVERLKTRFLSSVKTVTTIEATDGIYRCQRSN